MLQNSHKIKMTQVVTYMVTRSKKDNNRKQKAKIGNPRLMCSQNWFLEFENMKSL